MKAEKWVLRLIIGGIVLLLVSLPFGIYYAEVSMDEACATICETRHSRMKERNSIGCLCENGDVITESHDSTVIMPIPVVR
ncbi:MAG: hypothetical protein GY769_20095 [bacterium]|nr:hypothetical protein [bacterium]